MWYTNLYDEETAPLHQERLRNFARDANTIHHAAASAPYGGLGGDVAGLRSALDGLQQRFDPADYEEVRFRCTERSLNPRAGRPQPALSTVAKPFSDAWGSVQARAGGDLPRVAAVSLAAAEAAAADDDGDPLTLCLGDVVALDGGSGPYWGVLVQLFDPQTAQATYAHGVAARLWPRGELEASGWPRAAAQLADGEAALSNFFDYVRPNSILGKLRLVPEPWRDPTLPAGREFYFKRFLEWPQNSLRPLDFGLADDGSVRSAAALLTWLRHRHIASNSGWREQLDAFADRVYWTFHAALTSERAALVKGRTLPDLTVTFNRACLLLLPVSILSTAQHCYSRETGHQFRVLINTKVDAEAFLGPADTRATDPCSYGLVHRKPREAEPHTYYLSLPIELLFNPQKPGETDILHMHCHMFKMHLATMLWDTRTVVGPIAPN